MKLFEAIESGDTGQVWKAVQEGVRLDETEPGSGMTALALAAESGSAEIVRMLLEAGADPDRGGPTTPLEAAVVEGHAEVVRALIDAGADVNRRVAEGFTPLMSAATTGNARLVDLLLAAGARPQLTNDAGETALSLAVSGDHERVVEALQSHRRRRVRAAAEAREAAADVAGADEPVAEPAPEEPDVEVPGDDADGAVADETDAAEPESQEPVAVGDDAAPESEEPAAVRDDAEPESEEPAAVADAEVEAEEPAAVADSEPADAGETAASSPLDAEPSDAVPNEWLLGPARSPEPAPDAEGPDADAAAGAQEAPPIATEPVLDDWDLHFASGFEATGFGTTHFEATGLASDPEPPAGGSPPAEPSGDDPAAAAPEPASPPAAPTADPALFAELRQRLEEGDLDGLRRLLDGGGLGVEDRDEEGRTPLMLAAAQGDPEAVRWLLDAGADPNLTDATPSGASALIHAVRSPSPKRTEVVSLLVDAGADVNQPCGRNSRTPLMHAAETDVYLETHVSFGFALTTKTLIRLGADLEVQDRRGLTVWHQTKRNALGARTSSAYRRRLHQMLRVLEHAGAEPVASHLV